MDLASPAAAALPSTPIIASLRRALAAQLHREHELTIKFAVLRGLGISQDNAAGQLGITPAEAKVCAERLTRLHEDLRDP